MLPTASQLVKHQVLCSACGILLIELSYLLHSEILHDTPNRSEPIKVSTAVSGTMMIIAITRAPTIPKKLEGCHILYTIQNENIKKIKGISTI